MNKEVIEKIGQKVGAEIFAVAGVYTHDTWVPEFKALTNVEINQETLDQMVLETIVFGIYYLKRKFQGSFNNEEEEIFMNALNKQIVFSLSNIYFESSIKEKNPEEHEKIVQEVYNNLLNFRMKSYLEFKGGNILELFKLYILSVFNDPKYKSKVKFMKNTFINRIKLGFVKGVRPDLTNNAQFFDERIIDHYVANVINLLSGINIDDIISTMAF